MKKLAALIATSTLVLAGSALADSPIPTHLIPPTGVCKAAVDLYVGKGIVLRTRAEYKATGDACWYSASLHSAQQLVDMDYFTDRVGAPPAQ